MTRSTTGASANSAYSGDLEIRVTNEHDEPVEATGLPTEDDRPASPAISFPATRSLSSTTTASMSKRALETLEAIKSLADPERVVTSQDLAVAQAIVQSRKGTLFIDAPTASDLAAPYNEHARDSLSKSYWRVTPSRISSLAKTPDAPRGTLASSMRMSDLAEYVPSEDGDDSVFAEVWRPSQSSEVHAIHCLTCSSLGCFGGSLPRFVYRPSL